MTSHKNAVVVFLDIWLIISKLSLLPLLIWSTRDIMNMVICSFSVVYFSQKLSLIANQTRTGLILLFFRLIIFPSITIMVNICTEMPKQTV